jgi:hypothetical protein
LHRASRSIPIIAAGMLAGGLALPAAVMAQGASAFRAGSWEFQLPVTYSPSTSFDAQGGSSASLNSNLGFAVGLGYNVSNQFQLSGTVNWSTRSFNATFVDSNGAKSQAAGTLNSSTATFNGTYYFSPGAFAPFLTAGIGNFLVDTSIPNGKPSTGCWYDPWAGYVCSTYAPTKTETAVTYTTGIGLRWEVARGVALQGSFNRMWIEYSASKPQLDGWTLAVVFWQ